MSARQVFVVIILVHFSYGANILGIVPTPSYSHQIAFSHLWKELSLRGHKVTVITTDPLKDPTLVNLTEIDVSAAYQVMEDFNVPQLVYEVSHWTWHKYLLQILNLTANLELALPPVRKLIEKHVSQTFDVVLVETFNPEFLAFGEIYNCPTILICSFDSQTYFHRAFGNPVHPILNNDYASPFYGKLTLPETVMSTLYNWYVDYFETYTEIPAREAIMRTHFKNVTATLPELIRKVDLLFVNVNPIVQGVRLVGINTINIGGARPILTATVLPKELQEFVDNAKEGFIYLSFGNILKSTVFDAGTLKSIVETLRDLPYKVLWKYEADEVPGQPANVRIMKWIPQQRVLKHPNIKLFVTQGGLQSMEESIYSQVPMVVIPFFADQIRNAKLIESKGIGKVVYRNQVIQKDKLKDAITEVIQNPSYKNAVENLGKLALDAPMTGLERAVWWTEYAIRNKGAKELRSPAADLPLYQYFLLDVISFLLLVAFVIASATYVAAKMIVKLYLEVQRYRTNMDKKRQ